MRGDRSPTFGAIDGSGEGRRGFVSTYTTKASKAIRLDDDVYERLRDVKRDDETDSEAVERLLPDGSLLDLAGILEPEKVEEIEEGLADTDAKSKERRRALFGPTVILDASFLLDVMASDGDAIDRAAGIDSND